MKMEGRDNHGVVKNRSSSGCLVIKKKQPGIGGVGGSGGRKVFKPKIEKKRARVNASEEEEEDDHEELEYRRGRGGGGGVYDEFGAGAGAGAGYGRNGLMGEGGGMKRRMLDVYDFDEYDELSSDVDVMGGGMRYYYDRDVGERRYMSPRPEFESGGSKGGGGGSGGGDIIYKRRKPMYGSSTSRERIASGDYYSRKRLFERKSEMAVVESFGGSDEAIRLQGKNGVLKVRVKQKAGMSEPRPQGYRPVEGGTSVVRRCQELNAKNIVIQRHSPYSERDMPKKKGVVVGRVDKSQEKKPKSVSAKSSEESDEGSEDSDCPPKVQPDSVKVQRGVKRGRRAGSLPSSEKGQPVKMREGKVKRGSGTEKQLLREKIRSMLVSAGWTIDYRPRRGRDYSDAVYVNPSGTAFWSIIKAYDALQKQLEEEGKSLEAYDDSSSVAPIPEDMLSKLTRQTRKKIEKELKRKKREEGGTKRKKGRTARNSDEDESDTDSGGSGRHDEKLSTYIKRSGKGSKGTSRDACRDGNSPNSKIQERGENSASMSGSRFIHARNSKKIGRCTLLVRNSDKGLDSESDGFVPYTGKRNLLSWLVDSGTVKLSEKVHYMNRRRTRVMMEGWITRDGIHCACCSKILSVSKFEIHAASKLRQPFQNMYLSTGPSLLQCQVDAWNKQDESLRDGFNKIEINGDDPEDDTCAICGDGGNLICCDSCPSTFHQNCLDIKMLPPGDWHCPYCSCKYCGLANVRTAEGNDTKQDMLFACCLCEGKFHRSCMEKMDSTPIDLDSPVSACGKKCQEMFERLQKLLGVKHELEGGLCWSLIHRTYLGSDDSVRNFPQRVEWNSKLAVALTVMDECFLPIVDRRSGINMIHNVLYNCGSNFSRLNYSGFYTAVLERGDEIVSAASIRIRGAHFAEMPFIGTRHIYRRQGMCRLLFSAIESALRSFKVEKLIIPAISELMDTWTRVFGFTTLEESDRHEMKMMNMLVFPGTDMLQKKLLKHSSSERGLAGVDSFEGGHSAFAVPDLAKASDSDSSPGPCSAAALRDNEKTNDKSITDMMVALDGTSGRCALMAVSNEDKVPLHKALTDVPNEVTPPVSNEGIQATRSSALLVDINRSPADVNDHISQDGIVDTHVIETALDDSPGKRKVSADCKLTQEVSKASTDTECLLADDTLAGSVDNGLPGNDKAPCDGSFSCKIEAAADGKDHSVLEAPCDDAVMEVSEIVSPAFDKIRDTVETEVDDAYATPDKFADVCSEPQSLHVPDLTVVGVSHKSENHVSGNNVVNSQTTEQAMAGGDGIHRHLQNASHDCGEVKKTQPDSCDEIASHENAVMEISELVSPAIDKIRDFVESEVDDGHAAPAKVADFCSEPQSLHVMDLTVVGVSHEPKSVPGNDVVCSQTTEQAVVGGDEIYRPLQHASHDSVGSEEARPDSCDEIASRDNVVMKNSEIESPAVDEMRDSVETEVDDGHAALDQVADVCPDSQSLHVADLTVVGVSPEPKSVAANDVVCSQTTEQAMAGGDEIHELQHVSHDIVGAEETQPDSCDEMVSHDNAVMEKSEFVSPSVDKMTDFVETEVDDAHAAPSNPVYVCSEPQSLHVSDLTVVGVSHVPLNVLGNEQVMAGGDGIDRPLQHASHDTVEAEEVQPDSCGEMACHDNDVIEHSEIVSPAVVEMRDSVETEVDDAHPALDKVADVCSDSQSLQISDLTVVGVSHEAKSVPGHDVCSQSTEQEMAGGNVIHGLQHASHGSVGAEEAQPDSCDEMASDVNAVKEKSEFVCPSVDKMRDSVETEVVDAHAAPANVCSEPESLDLSDLTVVGVSHEPKNAPGNDVLCSQTTEQVMAGGDDSVGAKEARPGSSGEIACHDNIVMENSVILSAAVDETRDSNETEVDDAHAAPKKVADVCSDSQSLHFSDLTVVDASPMQKNHVSEASHDSVGVEKAQLDSRDISSSQTLLEGRLEVSNVQSVSNIPCEITASHVVANPHSSDNCPVNSADRCIADSSVSPEIRNKEDKLGSSHREYPPAVSTDGGSSPKFQDKEERLGSPHSEDPPTISTDGDICSEIEHKELKLGSPHREDRPAISTDDGGSSPKITKNEEKPGSPHIKDPVAISTDGDAGDTTGLPVTETDDQGSM